MQGLFLRFSMLHTEKNWEKLGPRDKVKESLTSDKNKVLVQTISNNNTGREINISPPLSPPQ